MGNRLIPLRGFKDQMILRNNTYLQLKIGRKRDVHGSTNISIYLYV